MEPDPHRLISGREVPAGGVIEIMILLLAHAEGGFAIPDTTFLRSASEDTLYFISTSNIYLP